MDNESIDVCLPSEDKLDDSTNYLPPQEQQLLAGAEIESVTVETRIETVATCTSTSPVDVQAVPTWKKVFKTISRIVWSVVIILILLQVTGRFAINHIRANAHVQSGESASLTVPTKITPELTAEISASLDHALTSAQVAASKELDVWKSEMMQRVDPKFLDWYFNYFNQLGIGLKGIWINLTVSSEEKKAEALIEGFQREFTKQVFQPELAQLELERITRNAAKGYMSQLSRELGGLKIKYDVPQADWDRYLRGISYTIFNSEGVQQDMNLRDAIRAGGGLVAVPSLKAGAVVTTKIASKLASGTATKAATKVATKAATKVAAEAGAKTVGMVGLQLIDPLAAIGILMWDVWDHYHTVKIERPILKENIERYLVEVKNSLLDNTEGSTMSSIYQLDNTLRQQLR